MASVDDPATWSSFDQAVKTWQQSRGRFDGVGYVFTANDPYCGIDLDKCIRDDGALDPDKLRWIEAFDSYTERSVSGRGLHTIVKGEVEQGRNDRKRGFEIYSSGRFFTFTGHSYHNEPLPIAERQAVINSFVAEVFTKPRQKAEPKQKAKPEQKAESVKPRPEKGRTVSINERLRKAFTAENGAKIIQLFNGNISGYGSQSEADLALCSLLAFYGEGSATIIDEMFRQSRLMRSKWDEKHYGDGRTYGEGTINKALTRITKFYEWQRHEHSDGNNGGNTQSVSADADAPKLIQTWNELDAQDLPVGEQIIHELERGEIGLLAAVTNVGKSTLLRNIALALACGGEFLPVVKRGPARRVLLLDFETRPARLQRDIRQMSHRWTEEERALIGRNLAIACDATINDEPLCLSEPHHLRRVQMSAAAFQADLIIVDTVAAAFSIQDENSNAEVNRRILKPMVLLSRDTSAAILMAHHIGKGKSEDGKASEKAYRARGASSFGGYASLVLNLTQDPHVSDRKTLSLAKSKGAQFDDVALTLDREARWFTVTSAPINRTPTSYDLVMKLFAEGGEMKTHEAIDALSGRVPERTVKRCLSDAVDRGDLKMPKRGIYRPIPKSATCAASIGLAQMALSPREAR